MHWFNHMKWSLYLLNKNKYNYKCQRRHFNPASQNDVWGTTAEIPYSWSYLGSTSDWLRQIYSLAARKVRSTTLIDLGNDTLSVRMKFLALVPQKVLIIALFFHILAPPGSSICPTRNVEVNPGSSVNVTGALHSPNSPNFYPDNQNCTVTLDVPDNYKTVVWFEKFSLQCK